MSYSQEAHVPHLDRVLSPSGWAYASSSPIGEHDPGRFHALFGRDALITALQVLPARPDVARATIRALAALQGRVDDPQTEEEPGRIIHERWPQAPERLLREGWPVRDGEARYFGSADATSWFLVLLASLDDRALERELEMSWRAAGSWLERRIEDGEGLVRYGGNGSGIALVQQGWRDTSDPTNPAFNGGGILREDCTAPEPPIADADTQAVAVVALRALAALSGSEQHREMAEQLRARVEHSFGPETMALESGGCEVRGAGSQLGWLLWADALGPETSDRVADRLLAPDVLTPFGVRTLSERHPAFAPDAYSRGGVWAFDSWLAWGGLRAAGRETEAERLRSGVLSALAELGGAPELYAVDSGVLRRIPGANHVQAWTVGARWALEVQWDGRVNRLCD